MGSETLGRGTVGRDVEFEPPTVEELDAQLGDALQVTQFIGRGGMGAVYKGRQPRLERSVAVKVLPPIDDEEKSATFDERFEREAQTMAKLGHPNIVAVYDFGETPSGLLYIVMEHVEGTDLATLIRAGELRPEHALRWVPQMCSALEYAHENGVVHRDIKPSNVLVAADGDSVKIADFGIARLSGEDDLRARMTLTEVAVGTPDYVAPEQMAGGSKVDHRADIYSLGVVMYEMLTGQLPRGVWKPPSERKSGERVTRKFDPIVHRAMQAEPEERYQRASEVGSAVGGIGGGSAEAGRSKPRWPWLVGGFASAGAVAALAFASSRPGAGGTEAESAGAGAPGAGPAPPALGFVSPTYGSEEPAAIDDPGRPAHAIPLLWVQSQRQHWLDDDFWPNGPAPGNLPEGEAVDRPDSEWAFQPYHYYIGLGRQVVLGGERDPTSVYFGGRSLTVGPGGSLKLMASNPGQEIAVDKLVLAGGHVIFPNAAAAFSSAVEVVAESSLGVIDGDGEQSDAHMVLAGAEPLHYRVPPGHPGIVLRGRSPDFSGGWVVEGDLRAHATSALGSGPITVRSGRLSSNDTVRLDGALDLWSGAELVLDQFWDVASARVGEVAVPPGDHDHNSLVALGLGGAFARGNGTLRVRGAWVAPGAGAPFAIPEVTSTATVERAQKRGACMHHPMIWTDLGVPSPSALPQIGGRLEGVSPYHYRIAPGGMLRTLYGSVTRDHFGGLSLTVERGGVLLDHGYRGTLVVHDLRLEGGRIATDHSYGYQHKQRFTIDGNLHVGADSQIGGGYRKTVAGDKPVYLRARITGGGKLVLDPGAGSRVVVESRANRDFTGGWEVVSGTLVAAAPGALGAGEVEVKAGARLELRAPQQLARIDAEDGAEVVEP